MGNRRMFCKTVVDSDNFLDMPLSSQALYFHLGMHCDDDGFVGSPQKIMRYTGCDNQDLQELTDRGFIIIFDNKVVAVTHFHQNNTIRKDRYTPTVYQQQHNQLVKINNEYRLKSSDDPGIYDDFIDCDGLDTPDDFDDLD